MNELREIARTLLTDGTVRVIIGWEAARRAVGESGLRLMMADSGNAKLGIKIKSITCQSGSA